MLYLNVLLKSTCDSPSPNGEEVVTDKKFALSIIGSTINLTRTESESIVTTDELTSVPLAVEGGAKVVGTDTIDDSDNGSMMSRTAGAVLGKTSQIRNTFFKAGLTLRSLLVLDPHFELPSAPVVDPHFELPSAPVVDPHYELPSAPVNSLDSLDIESVNDLESFVVNVENNREKTKENNGKAEDCSDSASTKEDSEVIDVSPSDLERKNLTGTFKLVKSNNFASFLKALDVPWAIRKAANVAKPVHIYTHVDDTFRVQIDSIIKGDTTYIINGPTIDSAIRHIKFVDRATYLDSGDGIVVRKIAQNPTPDGPIELIVKRRLLSDDTLVLLSKAIYVDGSESLESEQFFERIIDKK